MRLRKGMLVPEGMGLVIAIIGLVILGFFGVKLYNVFVEQDMKNAKTFIEGLNAKIENLDDGESNTFALRGVQDWVLVGWNASDKTRPEKCFLNSCLCLCKDSVANCQENGYCRAVDRNVSVKSDFIFTRFESDTIEKDSVQYNLRTSKISASCYIMPEKSLLIPFNIVKSSSLVLINVPSPDLNIGSPNPDKIISTFRLCSNYNDEPTS